MPGVTKPADLLFEHYCWPVTAVPLFCDNLKTFLYYKSGGV